MQSKQTKINNAKNPVNDFLNSTDSSNPSVEKRDTLDVGSRPIDYSKSSFDSFSANPEATMGATSAPDTLSVPQWANPPASADDSSKAQINLPPNAPRQTTSHFDGPRQRGRPDIAFFERLQIASRFWNPERPWGFSPSR